MEPLGLVLLDFGGPERPSDVRPFLTHLFLDPAILPVPGPVRALLARLIAWRRAPVATARYARIGGHSPGPAQVRNRATWLQRVLGDRFLVRCAFRYVPPFCDEVVEGLAQGGVRRLVALPSFPQRSFTTTDSCLGALQEAALARGMEVVPVVSYPDHPGLVEALAGGIRPLLTPGAHLLLVAHGLPERLLKGGDPYLDEVHRTVHAVVASLGPGLSWSLAFQSRLGPVAWVGPAIEDEIRRLGSEGVKALVVAPVSFTTENLETLYDLDLEAAHLARAAGIQAYARAPAPTDQAPFLGALVDLVRKAEGGAHES